MEDAHFTETEKSKTSEVKCENDALFPPPPPPLPPPRCSTNPGQTVNQEFYLEILRRLRENVRRKRRELWRSGDSFLDHDNAPAHTAVCDPVFGLSGMDHCSHPPYSSDVTPCEFFLFPTKKKTLKGKRFATVEEVKTASQEALSNIKLQQFQRCFTQWGRKIGQVFCLQ